MQYMAQLLVSTATMAAIVSGEETLITINTKKVHHVVSDRFLSLTVDPAILLEVARTSSESLQMLAMARTLAPAFLRVAGPDSNYYHFQKAVDPDRSMLSADYTVTELQWMVLNEFAQQAGLHLVAVLGVLDRENGAWSSRNSLELISLSDRLGYNISWQLGYELQELEQEGEEEVSGSQLGQDVVQLRKMLDMFPRYRRSLVLGPDITRFEQQEDILFLKEFFSKANGAISAATWHPHFKNGIEKPGEAELLMNILGLEGNALRKSIGRTFNKKPLWLAESGGSTSRGRFKDALVWGQRLGAAAQLGAEVLMKKLSVPIMTQPSPEYWVSVLYKSLVGHAVLDTRMIHGNHTHLRVFAHCVTDRGTATPRYEMGAVVVFGVNLMGSNTTLTLKATSWGRSSGEQEVHQYVLASASDLESGDVLLNNQLLKLNPDGSLPIIVPTIQHVEHSIKVTIPPNTIGFWVMPEAKVRACMTQAAGKRTDFEGLESEHHTQMKSEYPEVNTNFINSDIVGLRRLPRKHGVLPKMSSLRSKRRENKGKMASSETAENDKRKKNLGRSKRFTPLENGPYVIPGLSVELFNPSQHLIKSRIGTNKRKKNFFNQSGIKLPTSRQSVKNFETDDDYDDDNDFTIKTNVQASLIDPDYYYSTEENKHFHKHQKRAHGTGFAQHDMFLTTGTGSQMGDFNKDYTYVDDDSILDYKGDDTESGMVYQDEAQYFHGPRELFEDVKFLPTKQTHQHENFGDLWEVNGFTNRNEQVSKRPDAQTSKHEMISTPNMHMHTPHNLHVNTIEYSPDRYAKNSIPMRHISNGNRGNENSQSLKQILPKYTTQKNDHEFLIYNGRDNMNGRWMHKGEYGEIRRHNLEEKKINFNTEDEVGNVHSRKMASDVSEPKHTQNNGLEKSTATFDIQLPDGEKLFVNADASAYHKEKTQNMASKKSNFNEENGSEIPKALMEVYTKRIMENSSEENDPYTLKQQNNIKRITSDETVENCLHIKQKPTITEAGNYSYENNQTMEPGGENVLFDEDTNKTHETDKQQNDTADVEEHSIEVMTEKKRSRRDVSARYKYLPSTHFLNHNKEHGYVVNVEPLTRSSEEPRKYLDDYEDYDTDSRTTLEDLIFTRIHPNQNIVPEIINRVMPDKQARSLVKLEFRPTLEPVPLYHNYYTVNGIDSKSKFKRDDTKQLQDENLEQPKVHSNRQFATVNVIDYNDKILHPRDLSKKKSENGKSATKLPDEITSYSPVEVINDGNSIAREDIYKQHVTRQGQHAEKKNFAERMRFAYTSEEEHKNETQMTDSQRERKVRNSHSHEAKTEAVPSYDLTTSLIENIITQEETTIKTQETENVDLNRLQMANEKMQTNQPDMTTEDVNITNRKNNIGNTEKNSTSLLDSITEDKYNASTINNYISSSSTKTPNNAIENTNNLYTKTEQFQNNLDPDSFQSSGDFKQSRKRENTNDNTYNRIRLPIPKEDDSKEKMTDMYSFITTIPETANKNGFKEETFMLATNNVKDSTMIPNANRSKENKDALTGAAKVIASDTLQSMDEATQTSHEKNARNAAISDGNDTSKIGGTEKSKREHLVRSSQQHLSSSQDKAVTDHSYNGREETATAGTQDIRSKKDASNEILPQHANDSATHPAQTSRTMGNTETTDTYSIEDKTTIIESRSVSAVTGDAASYAKSTKIDINSSKLHHKSEESSNEFTSNVNNNVNSNTDINDKMDIITFGPQKSLHSQDARFKDASETHESSAGNENGDKEERKDNTKASRFIRMQGETPGTRYSLLDITKRREERIKALNERRAKLRAKLLARTQNADHERKDTSHRRKLREALDDSSDIDVSSTVTQNNFSPYSVTMDNVSTEKLKPSASKESFIEQYLLQQQKQMPEPIKQNDHSHITDGGYNDTNIWHTQVSVPQNPIKSFQYNTIRQHPWYYYQSPVKAYTSFIMNSITQAHTADSNTETQKKKHSHKVHEYGGRDDVNAFTAPHEENQNDERKQRLVRETQPLHSNMRYYIHPQTEESYTFSDMEGSSEYPFPSNYDYSKLENSHMPAMNLNYDAHPDNIMTDYLDHDLLQRHGRHVYIMEDDQWPGNEKYYGKLEQNQLLPLMFEMHDPDIYEEENIYDPEHSDDVIFDMYYPDYKGYYNVLPNEYMADRSWAEFLHMLDEIEVEVENKRELAKLKDKGGSPQDGTEMHSTHFPLLDGSHNKNVINDKMHSSTRYKRSVNLHEITIYPKDANHETLTNTNKNTESLPTKDNLQVQEYKAKSIKPTIYKRWYLLKGEKEDINRRQKTLEDEEWPKYSINKNREDWDNIKKVTPLTKLTINHRNSYIESNTASSTAKMEDSQQMMKSEDTEEEMHVLLFLHPDDQSTDKIAAWKDNEEDKLSMTEPNVISNQPLEDQKDFHESHLTDQYKSINFFDNKNEVDDTIATKRTKGQTESNINFASIIVHAIGTIIKLFKEFTLL